MAQLDPSTPVFALDDDCVMSGASFEFASVEEVTASCVRRVIEICSSIALERQVASKDAKVDIVLAGWSYGGVISSMMAQQLTQSPVVNVEKIILFDPPLRKRATASGEEVVPVLNADSQLTKQNIVDPQHEQTADEFAEERAEYHFSRCTALLRVFQQRPVVASQVRCPLLYIFPKESDYICGEDAAAEITSGKVTSLESPGTHWTMLFGNNASIVAGMIAQF